MYVVTTQTDVYDQRCQAQSWKAEHKYECKALGRVYPNVPPTAVRVVMQLLLRRQAGSLSEGEWQDLLKLEAHLEGFPRDKEPIGPGKGTKSEDIRLMSQAASAFSGVSQPLDVIQALIARVSCTQAPPIYSRGILTSMI